MTTLEQSGPSTATIPRVNIGWLHPFFEILDEVGASWEELLERAHLPVLASDDGSTLVPTSRVYAFVALAAQETKLDDLGLQAGARLEITPLLPDPEDAWTRPGVFRSIRSFIQVALDSSSNVEMWIEARPGRKPTTEFFYRGTFGTDHPAFPTVEQFMVALMVRWARYGAGPNWNPSRVNLRAESVPEAAIRGLVGEASVHTAQSATSIVFPSQPFVGPVEPFPQRGSKVWQRHRQSLAQAQGLQDLAASLRVVLRAYLPDGSPDIKLAARLTGTSVRTLQRRLQEQGLTYARLLKDLRHDLAIELLRDPALQASEVSRELGYRDPAVFTRAFRRWTGSTPSEFRRSLSVS
jgi:AraC-like DNA-binding protein